MASYIEISQTLIHAGIERKVARIFQVYPFGLPAGITNDLLTAAGQLIGSSAGG